MYRYVLISNTFFVIGVMLLSFELLSLIFEGGGFAGFSYLIYWMTEGIRSRKIDSPRKNYYDFSCEFGEKIKKNRFTKKYRFFLIGIGVICILISLAVCCIK